jgi:hypothetical protein
MMSNQANNIDYYIDRYLINMHNNNSHVQAVIYGVYVIWIL